MGKEHVNLTALLNDAGHALTQLAAVIARRDQLEDRLTTSGPLDPNQLAQLNARLHNLDVLVVANHALAATLVNQVNEELLTSEKYVRSLARAARLDVRIKGGLIQ